MLEIQQPQKTPTCTKNEISLLQLWEKFWKQLKYSPIFLAGVLLVYR